MNKKALWAWLGFAALVFCAFVPALSARFIVDDDYLILRNPQLDSLRGLKQIWFSLINPDYWPASYTSFWIEKQFFVIKPFPYHLVNLLLQATNATLLFFILRRLNVRFAWFGAALFAIHPIMTESVAWVAELKNLQTCLFGLLCVWSFLRYIENRAGKWYVLSLLFFLLGILSKITLAPLPAVIFLIVWWRRLLPTRQLVKTLIPHLLIAIAFALFNIWVHHNRAGGERANLPEGLLAHVDLAVRNFWFYPHQLLVPVHFSFNYPRWDLSTGMQILQWIGLAAILVLGILFWVKRESWGRCGIIAFGSYLVLIAPVLGFVGIYFFQFSFVADRYGYLASIPLLVLIASGLGKFFSLFVPEKFLPVALGLLLIPLGYKAHQECGKFYNLQALWEDTLEKRPNSIMAYNGRGVHLTMIGRKAAALPEFERAIEIDPNYVEARNNLANVLNSMGRKEEAEAIWKYCLEKDPDFILPLISYSGFLIEEKRFSEAIVYLQRAVQQNPYSGELQFSLAYALNHENRHAEAMAPLRIAIDQKPEDPQARHMLAQALLITGNEAEALKEMRTVLDYQPLHLETIELLAQTLADKGNKEDALFYADRGLGLARLLNRAEMIKTFEDLQQKLRP